MKKEICKWCNGELPDKNWCMDCNGTGIEKLNEFVIVNSRRHSRAISSASEILKMLNNTK